MANKSSIFNLSTGQSCLVEDLTNGGNLYYKQRLLAQGVIPGIVLTIKRKAPFGDPIEVSLPCGDSFVIRKQEAANIIKIKSLAEE